MTARTKNDLLALVEALILAVAATVVVAAIWQAAGGPRRDFLPFGIAFGLVLQAVSIVILFTGGGRMSTVDVAMKLLLAGLAVFFGSCGVSARATIPRFALVFGLYAIIPIIHALLTRRSSDGKPFFSRAAVVGSMNWPTTLAGLSAFLTLRFASLNGLMVVVALLIAAAVVIRLRFRPQWNGLPFA